MKLLDSRKSNIKGELRYSTLIWWNILSKVITNLWIDVLFQFGLTNQRVERMLSTWLTGWEVDLVSSIWASRSVIQGKYLKHREFDILNTILPERRQYFYLKPILMLTLRYQFAWRHFSALTKPYDQILFTTDLRPIIDRTAFFDGLIFLLCELYKMYTIDANALIQLLRTNLSNDWCQSRKVFYNAFSYCKIDTHTWMWDTYIARQHEDKVLTDSIIHMYETIKPMFREQGIVNIQDYTKQMTGHLSIHKWNHQFHNFVSWRPPNIMLQTLRSMFRAIKDGTNNLPTES